MKIWRNTQLHTSDKYILITKVLLIVAIVPLLLLAFFSQPAADDYGQAYRVHAMGFWGAQHFWYTHMNGRFIYMAAFSIYITVLDLDNYWIFTWFIYGALLLSVYLLVHSLGSPWFSRKTIIWSSLAFILIYVSRLPILSEGFYWLSGAMAYQLGNILFILLIAILCLMFRTSSQCRCFIYTAIASLLAACIVAINEIFILPLFACLVLCILFLFCTKNQRSLFVLCIFLVSCISAYFVITAPGTLARSLNFPNRHQIWFSLSSSVGFAFGCFKQWAFDPIVLSSTLIFLPSVSKVANCITISEKTMKILIFFPIVWLCIFVFSFFPAFWALGGFPPERTLNSIFLFFILGWYPSISILTMHLVPLQKLDTIVSRHLRNAAMVIFLFSLFCFPNLYTAIKDLLFHAYPYHQEVKERIESTQKSVSENLGYVVIRPLKNRPVSLFSRNFEFKGDPENHWVDYDWELYWGLKVIFKDDSNIQ